MTSTLTKKTSLIQYSPATIKRGKRALSCSPFELNLFKIMMQQSVSLTEISSSKGQTKGYTRQEITEIKAEKELMWLIKVGILRREVDGQGITDSFRLTPLGREIVNKIQKHGYNLAKASILDRIINALNRWLSWQL